MNAARAPRAPLTYAQNPKANRDRAHPSGVSVETDLFAVSIRGATNPARAAFSFEKEKCT